MLKFGDKVKDKISGFCGVLTGRVEYDNGCVKWIVEPQRLTSEGKPVEPKWFDEQRLTEQSKAEGGGPMNLPPKA